MIANRRVNFCFILVASAGLAIAARHTRAGIVDDFQFGDANGTVLQSAFNSANASHAWNEDDEGEMAPSTVQGGLYHITKGNDAIGSNYFDVDNIGTGKGWLVMEMSGWSFSSLVGPSEFDAAEPEEVRLAFLNNDGNAQGGSTITGQAVIERTAAGGLQLSGKLTTGVPEIAPVALTLVRSTAFSVVLEIDENAESFSVYYKDDAAPYTLLGTAPHTTGRNGNSVRFFVNNNFGGTGEFFDINRLYVTDVNPIPEISSFVFLGIGLGLLRFVRRS